MTEPADPRPSRPPIFFWPLLLGAVVYLVTALMVSFAQVGRPFPGFFVLWPRVVDAIQLDHWNGATAGIQVGDIIVGVDGRLLANGQEVHRHVDRLPVGQRVVYELIRGDGRRHTVPVATQTLSFADWLATFGGLWLAGALHLLIGAVVTRWRPDSDLAWRHWWFCLAIAIYLASLAGIVRAELGWAVPGALAQGLTGVTAFLLAARLPRVWPLLRRHGWIEGALSLLWIALLVQAIVGYVRLEPYSATSPIFSLAVVGCLLIILSAAWGWLSRHSTVAERALAALVLTGSAAAFLPATLFTVYGHVYGHNLPYGELAYMGLLIFPLTIAHAIVRRQLFGLQAVIRRGVFHGVLILCLTALYAGLSAIGDAWLNGGHPGGGLPGLLMAAILAVAFQPLQELLKRGFRRLFLGQRGDVLQLLSHFPPAMPTDPAEVARELAHLVWQGMNAAWVYVRLVGGQRFAIGPVPAWAETWQPGPAQTAISEAIETDAGVVLALDLQASHGREGCLIIGPSQSGMAYVLEDRGMLVVLAVHAAVALHAAELFRQRVQLSVKKATADTLTAERDKVLQGVMADLHDDLGAIRAAAAAMGRAPHREEAYTIVRASLTRVTRYLDSRSEWLRTEAGPAEAVLASVMARAVASVGAEARRHEARIDTVLPAAPVALTWPEAQIEWLTATLLRAAIGVMATGSEVVLRAQPFDDVLVISVSTRAGSDSAGLFEPFGDRQKQLRTLGLLKAAETLEPHGGRIVCHADGPSALVEAWLPLQPRPSRSLSGALMVDDGEAT